MALDVAPRLAELGYVVVDAAAPAEGPARRRLAGRHVALIAGAGRGASHAVRWIRELSQASCRAHVLVWLEDALAWHGSRARERAPAYHAGSEGPPARALARVRTGGDRARPASERRWLHAAVEEALRYGRQQRAVLLANRLSEMLCGRGDWQGARRQARALLPRLSEPVARNAAVRRATSLAIHVGDLDDAESLTAAVAAEAMVSARAAPSWTTRRLVEVRLWQGRTEEAAACLDELDDWGEASDAAAFWRAVLAWILRDAADWRWPAASSRFATAVISLLRGSTRPLVSDVREAGGAPAAIVLAALDDPDGLRGWRGVAPVAAVRALRELGNPRYAGRVAERLRRRRTPSPLESLLAGALDRAGPAAESWLRDAPNELRRLGRVGIAARVRGGEMHQVEALPALLQLLSDAEDDTAALDAVCGWARRQSGVEGAAVVGSHGEWAAGHGLARSVLADRDLRAACAAAGPRVTADRAGATAVAPVRYAGVDIGAVVLHGAPDVVETLHGLASTLAPLCGPALRVRLDAMATARARDRLIPEILGGSPGIDAVRLAVARAAGTAFPVLIEGESGTGKELVARALHRLSARRDRPLCPVNCAALTDDLVEAELFGHARGAFTGAVGARAGLFEEADRGTLFMDEIGELSPRAQAKVLRALQDGEIRRLGENSARRVDVRVVAATNRPLAAAVSRGEFREDLLFRLAVARIRIPPLRERLEDVPVLAHTFWARAASETGTRALLGPDALVALCRQRWPGNVRELQNAMAALVLVSPARGRVGARHVAQVLSAAEGGPEPAAMPLVAARRQFERRRIAEALARHGGRRIDAARELGLSRQGLAKALRRVGLTDQSARAGVA